ncbi:MAG: cell division protein FtsZ [Selenomonadaceae bacterium]|nr:cell division protein FtsZ [Selenomonadaceae bacterium]
MEANESAIKEAVVTIKIFGVGDGGNSVLKRISENNSEPIELIAINTDMHALKRLDSAKVKIMQVGKSTLKGRGTGGNVTLGENAVKRDIGQIKKQVQGSDIVFVTAGMGGGTGTAIAPIVAQIANELGILTVGVVTLPFNFEGRQKLRIAEEGILKMQSYTDALIVIKNDNLIKLPENKIVSMMDAFTAADMILLRAINCVTELILTTGVINVDFADITTVLRQGESSDAIIGIGYSDKNPLEALQNALKSPLTDKSLKGSRGIILNVTGDENLSIYDVNEAADYIYKNTADDVNIIFGTVLDKSMNGKIRVTIIATDFVNGLTDKTEQEKPKETETVSNGFHLNMPKTPPQEIGKSIFEMPKFVDRQKKD